MSVKMQPTAFEHPRFHVIPRESRKLVIFFSSTHENDDNIWKSAAKRSTASAIYINSNLNNWHQDGVEGLGDSIEEVTQTIQQWASHLGATRIYTIGAGLGGSASLLYGSQLGANILAFDPEAPLETVDLRPLLSQAKGKAAIIVGESDPSALLSASNLTNIIGVNVSSLKKVSSRSHLHLKSRKKIVSLIRDFIEDRRLEDFEEEGMGVHTSGFPKALYKATQSDLKKDIEATERAAADALAFYPESELANALLGKSIMLQGRPKEALPFLRLAAKMHSKAENRFLYGTCLLRVGRRSDAEGYFRQMVERYPSAAEGYYGLAATLAASNDYQHAAQEMSRAVKLAPERASFARKLQIYKAELKSKNVNNVKNDK